MCLSWRSFPYGLCLQNLGLFPKRDGEASAKLDDFSGRSAPAQWKEYLSCVPRASESVISVVVPGLEVP